MLNVGGIDHVTIHVSNIKVSELFYDQLMLYLGFKKEFSQYGYAVWMNGHFYVFVKEAQLPSRNEPFDEKRVGMNHVSIRAFSREDVDLLYKFLLRNKIPAESPRVLNQFGTSTYFISFSDPDGIRIEFGLNVNETK